MLTLLLYHRTREEFNTRMKHVNLRLGHRMHATKDNARQRISESIQHGFAETPHEVAKLGVRN